jgi:uncharacterized protein YraI
MKRAVVATLAAVLFAGCASPGVIPAGPDTFTVSSGTSWGWSSAQARAEVYALANKFCEDRGLVMVPLSIDTIDGVTGRNTPSATLVFRALQPGDPEIKRVNIEAPDNIQRIQRR